MSPFERPIDAGTRRPRVTDPDEVRRRIEAQGRWWHEIELAPGVVTPGDDSNRMKLPILEQLGLPADLAGVRALDIGCSDGYFAFELEARGAEVVAIDFVPPTSTGFAVAAEILGSDVEYRVDTVYNLDPETYGTFDLVFFLGVLYHLRKPLAALDSIRSVMKPGAELYVATFMIDRHVLLPDGQVTTLEALHPTLREIPLWQAYPGGSLNGDHTNCFAPNLAALRAALGEAQLEVQSTRIVDCGGYARALAVDDPLAAKYQALDGRLEDSPLDPTVPYYLDEDGATHEIAGRRTAPADRPTDSIDGEPLAERFRAS